MDRFWHWHQLTTSNTMENRVLQSLSQYLTHLHNKYRLPIFLSCVSTTQVTKSWHKKLNYNSVQSTDCRTLRSTRVTPSPVTDLFKWRNLTTYAANSFPRLLDSPDTRSNYMQALTFSLLRLGEQQSLYFPPLKNIMKYSQNCNQDYNQLSYPNIFIYLSRISSVNKNLFQ